jgi:hypothetical protein
VHGDVQFASLMWGLYSHLKLGAHSSSSTEISALKHCNILLWSRKHSFANWVCSSSKQNLFILNSDQHELHLDFPSAGGNDISHLTIKCAHLIIMLFVLLKTFLCWVILYPWLNLKSTFAIILSEIVPRIIHKHDNYYNKALRAVFWLCTKVFLLARYEFILIPHKVH